MLFYYLAIRWREGHLVSAPNPSVYRYLHLHSGGRFCLNLRWCLSHRYYSATILQMSGVRDDKLAIWLAGLTTLTNFLFTLLGVWLVERVGRRKLTLGSILGRTFWTSTCGRDGFAAFYSVFTFNRYLPEFESVGRWISNVSPAQPSRHSSPNKPIFGQLHLLQIPVSTQSPVYSD